MKERQPCEPKPYWQQDIAIGEGCFFGEPYTIRMRVHTAQERHYGRDEIVPLPHKTGERIPRTYVHARPYILVPEITLTMALYQNAHPSGAIGEVTASEWEGMRQLDIGNCQAWHYPHAQTAILWEAYLEDRYQQENPSEDASLVALWTGFQRLLLEQFRGVERIATPSREPICDDVVWQGFLRARGYAPFNEQAFVKAV